MFHSMVELQSGMMEELYRAAQAGDTEHMKTLFVRGATVNSASAQRRFVQLAATSGDQELLKMLLQRGMALRDPSSSLEALHYAAEDGEAELVELLLEHGARPYVNDVIRGVKDTALHLAVRGGHLEATQVLLNHCANISSLSSTRRCSYDIQDTFDFFVDENVTPLHISAEEGHFEVTKALLAKGPDINASTEYGYTPLHLAVIENHDDIVRLLLEQGAKISVLTKEGESVVDIATRRRHHKILKTLEEHMMIVMIATEMSYEEEERLFASSRVKRVPKRKQSKPKMKTSKQVRKSGEGNGHSITTTVVHERQTSNGTTRGVHDSKTKAPHEVSMSHDHTMRQGQDTGWPYKAENNGKDKQSKDFSNRKNIVQKTVIGELGSATRANSDRDTALTSDMSIASEGQGDEGQHVTGGIIPLKVEKADERTLWRSSVAIQEDENKQSIETTALGGDKPDGIIFSSFHTMGSGLVEEPVPSSPDSSFTSLEDRPIIDCSVKKQSTKLKSRSVGQDKTDRSQSKGNSNIPTVSKIYFRTIKRVSVESNDSTEQSEEEEGYYDAREYHNSQSPVNTYVTAYKTYSSYIYPVPPTIPYADEHIDEQESPNVRYRDKTDDEIFFELCEAHGSNHGTSPARPNDGANAEARWTPEGDIEMAIPRQQNIESISDVNGNYQDTTQASSQTALVPKATLSEDETSDDEDSQFQDALQEVTPLIIAEQNLESTPDSHLDDSDEEYLNDRTMKAAISLMQSKYSYGSEELTSDSASEYEEAEVSDTVEIKKTIAVADPVNTEKDVIQFGEGNGTFYQDTVTLTRKPNADGIQVMPSDGTQYVDEKYADNSNNESKTHKGKDEDIMSKEWTAHEPYKEDIQEELSDVGQYIGEEVNCPDDTQTPEASTEEIGRVMPSEGTQHIDEEIQYATKSDNSNDGSKTPQASDEYIMSEQRTAQYIGEEVNCQDDTQTPEASDEEIGSEEWTTYESYVQEVPHETQLDEIRHTDDNVQQNTINVADNSENDLQTLQASDEDVGSEEEWTILEEYTVTETVFVTEHTADLTPYNSSEKLASLNEYEVDDTSTTHVSNTQIPKQQTEPSSDPYDNHQVTHMKNRMPSADGHEVHPLATPDLQSPSSHGPNPLKESPSDGFGQDYYSTEYSITTEDEQPDVSVPRKEGPTINHISIHDDSLQFIDEDNSDTTLRLTSPELLKEQKELHKERTDSDQAGGDPVLNYYFQQKMSKEKDIADVRKLKAANVTEEHRQPIRDACNHSEQYPSQKDVKGISTKSEETAHGTAENNGMVDQSVPELNVTPIIIETTSTGESPLGVVDNSAKESPEEDGSETHGRIFKPEYKEIISQEHDKPPEELDDEDQEKLLYNSGKTIEAAMSYMSRKYDYDSGKDSSDDGHEAKKSEKPELSTFEIPVEGTHIYPHGTQYKVPAKNTDPQKQLRTAAADHLEYTKHTTSATPMTVTMLNEESSAEPIITPQIKRNVPKEQQSPVKTKLNEEDQDEAILDTITPIKPKKKKKKKPSRPSRRLLAEQDHKSETNNEALAEQLNDANTVKSTPDAIHVSISDMMAGESPTTNPIRQKPDAGSTNEKDKGAMKKRPGIISVSHSSTNVLEERKPDKGPSHTSEITGSHNDKIRDDDRTKKNTDIEIISVSSSSTDTGRNKDYPMSESQNKPEESDTLEDEEYIMDAVANTEQSKIVAKIDQIIIESLSSVKEKYKSENIPDEGKPETPTKEREELIRQRFSGRPTEIDSLMQHANDKNKSENIPDETSCEAKSKLETPTKEREELIRQRFSGRPTEIDSLMQHVDLNQPTIQQQQLPKSHIQQQPQSRSLGIAAIRQSVSGDVPGVNQQVSTTIITDPNVKPDTPEKKVRKKMKEKKEKREKKERKEKKIKTKQSEESTPVITTEGGGNSSSEPSIHTRTVETMVVVRKTEKPVSQANDQERKSEADRQPLIRVTNLDDYMTPPSDMQASTHKDSEGNIPVRNTSGVGPGGSLRNTLDNSLSGLAGDNPKGILQGSVQSIPDISLQKLDMCTPSVESPESVESTLRVSYPESSKSNSTVGKPPSTIPLVLVAGVPVAGSQGAVQITPIMPSPQQSDVISSNSGSTAKTSRSRLPNLNEATTNITSQGSAVGILVSHHDTSVNEGLSRSIVHTPNPSSQGSQAPKSRPIVSLPRSGQIISNVSSPGMGEIHRASPHGSAGLSVEDTHNVIQHTPSGNLPGASSWGSAVKTTTDTSPRSFEDTGNLIGPGPDHKTSIETSQRLAVDTSTVNQSRLLDITPVASSQKSSDTTSKEISHGSVQKNPSSWRSTENTSNIDSSIISPARLVEPVRYWGRKHTSGDQLMHGGQHQNLDIPYSSGKGEIPPQKGYSTKDLDENKLDPVQIAPRIPRGKENPIKTSKDFSIPVDERLTYPTVVDERLSLDQHEKDMRVDEQKVARKKAKSKDTSKDKKKKKKVKKTMATDNPQASEPMKGNIADVDVLAVPVENTQVQNLAGVNVLDENSDSLKRIEASTIPEYEQKHTMQQTTITTRETISSIGCSPKGYAEESIPHKQSVPILPYMGENTPNPSSQGSQAPKSRPIVSLPRSGQIISNVSSPGMGEIHKASPYGSASLSVEDTHNEIQHTPSGNLPGASSWGSALKTTTVTSPRSFEDTGNIIGTGPDHKTSIETSQRLAVDTSTVSPLRLLDITPVASSQKSSDTTSKEISHGSVQKNPSSLRSTENTSNIDSSIISPARLVEPVRYWGRKHTSGDQLMHGGQHQTSDIPYSSGKEEIPPQKGYFTKDLDENNLDPVQIAPRIPRGKENPIKTSKDFSIPVDERLIYPTVVDERLSLDQHEKDMRVDEQKVARKKAKSKDTSKDKKKKKKVKKTMATENPETSEPMKGNIADVDVLAVPVENTRVQNLAGVNVLDENSDSLKRIEASTIPEYEQQHTMQQTTITTRETISSIGCSPKGYAEESIKQSVPILPNMGENTPTKTSKRTAGHIPKESTQISNDKALSESVESTPCVGPQRSVENTSRKTSIDSVENTSKGPVTNSSDIGSQGSISNMSNLSSPGSKKTFVLTIIGHKSATGTHHTPEISFEDTHKPYHQGAFHEKRQPKHDHTEEPSIHAMEVTPIESTKSDKSLRKAANDQRTAITTDTEQHYEITRGPDGLQMLPVTQHQPTVRYFENVSTSHDQPMEQTQYQTKPMKIPDITIPVSLKSSNQKERLRQTEGSQDKNYNIHEEMDHEIAPSRISKENLDITPTLKEKEASRAEIDSPKELQDEKRKTDKKKSKSKDKGKMNKKSKKKSAKDSPGESIGANVADEEILAGQGEHVPSKNHDLSPVNISGEKSVSPKGIAATSTPEHDQQYVLQHTTITTQETTYKSSRIGLGYPEETTPHRPSVQILPIKRRKLSEKELEEDANKENQSFVKKEGDLMRNTASQSGTTVTPGCPPPHCRDRRSLRQTDDFFTSPREAAKKSRPMSVPDVYVLVKFDKGSLSNLGVVNKDNSNVSESAGDLPAKTRQNVSFQTDPYFLDTSEISHSGFDDSDLRTKSMDELDIDRPPRRTRGTDQGLTRSQSGGALYDNPDVGWGSTQHQTRAGYKEIVMPGSYISGSPVARSKQVYREEDQSRGRSGQSGVQFKSHDQVSVYHSQTHVGSPNYVQVTARPKSRPATQRPRSRNRSLSTEPTPGDTPNRAPRPRPRSAHEPRQVHQPRQAISVDGIPQEIHMPTPNTKVSSRSHSKSLTWGDSREKIDHQPVEIAKKASPVTPRQQQRPTSMPEQHTPYMQVQPSGVKHSPSLGRVPPSQLKGSPQSSSPQQGHYLPMYQQSPQYATAGHVTPQQQYITISPTRPTTKSSPIPKQRVHGNITRISPGVPQYPQVLPSDYIKRTSDPTGLRGRLLQPTAPQDDETDIW